MKPARFLDPARQELRDAAKYYEKQAEGLGFEFMRQIDAAILDIQENPESWPFITEGIHRRLICRFPYGLLYRVDPEEIVVLAVMHLRRRPLYWKSRRLE